MNVRPRIKKSSWLTILMVSWGVWIGLVAQTDPSDDRQSTEQANGQTTGQNDSVEEQTSIEGTNQEVVNSTIQSTSESRREALRFGIHSEVIEVLRNLKNEMNDRLNETVLELFIEASHPDVRIAILELFEVTEDPALIEHVIASVEDPLPDDEYIIECLRYLNDMVIQVDEFPGLSEVPKFYERLLDHENDLVVGYAVRGMGRLGEDIEVERLLMMLNAQDTSERLKDDIVLALGDAKVESAVEELSEIVRDPTADRSLRWYACDALGKIGTEECFRVIVEVLTDEDTMLRTYAVSALGYFTGTDEILELLIQSLRDSFWRVRVGALKAIGEIASTMDVTPAVDILAYKAKRDPEQNVRAEAIRTLGKIGVQSGIDVLLEIYKNPRESQTLRIEALESVISENSEMILPNVLSVVRGEWDKSLSGGNYQPVLKFVEQSCEVLSGETSRVLEDFFLKCIGHPQSVAIQIYGLRGIALNGFSSALDVVEEMTGERYATSVRREAKETLETLNGGSQRMESNSEDPTNVE